MRSTAVDAFVVTDTYLGNPQAAWLEERRVPFVAFGRPWEDPEATHPWVDVDGAAGGALATDHLIERGHERIAWIGWRKDSRIGEDRRAGWTSTMRERGLATTGLARPGRGHRRVRPRRLRAAAQRGPADRVRLCLATPWPWACCTPSPSAASGSARTSRSSASTTPSAAQVVPPGLTSVRQPLEEVAVEVVGALNGLLGPAPRRTPAAAAQPDPACVRGSLR